MCERGNPQMLGDRLADYRRSRRAGPSLAITLLFLAVCLAIVTLIFKMGYRLRTEFGRSSSFAESPSAPAGSAQGTRAGRNLSGIRLTTRAASVKNAVREATQ
jgi:hypothetical protein